MKLPCLFLLAFTITACSSGTESPVSLGSAEQPEPVDIPEHLQDIENLTAYPADTEPSHSIEFVPVQTYGDSDEHIFGVLGNITVDEAGRLYIIDNRQNTVVVYHPDGHLLGTLGREGSGPGESRQLVTAYTRPGLLYTYDLSMSRLNVYTIPEDQASIPEYSHAVIINRENWSAVAAQNSMSPLLYDVRPDGSFLVYSRLVPTVFRENPDMNEVFRYHILSADGQSYSEEIFSEVQPKNLVTEWFIIPPSFAAEDEFAIASNGNIYMVSTDEFLIRVLDPEGNYQRAVYHPFEKRILEREEAINSAGDIPQLQEAIRDLDLPDTWPAINSLESDDLNRVWVSTTVEDDEIHEWWVLDGSGQLLARFDWPRSERIELIRNGYLYTRVADSESGLRRIIKYRIQLTE